MSHGFIGIAFNTKLGKYHAQIGITVTERAVLPSEYQGAAKMSSNWSEGAKDAAKAADK